MVERRGARRRNENPRAPRAPNLEHKLIPEIYRRVSIKSPVPHRLGGSRRDAARFRGMARPDRKAGRTTRPLITVSSVTVSRSREKSAGSREDADDGFPGYQSGPQRGISISLVYISRARHRPRGSSWLVIMEGERERERYPRGGHTWHPPATASATWVGK